nr:serine/threonine-protein kinase [uncultured Dyadobacter sp.]
MAQIQLSGTKATYLFDPKNQTDYLGTGGMGVVFRGKGISKETGKDRPVAVKILFRDLTENISVVERVRRSSEIRILHNNLIEMLDFIEQDGICHDVSAYIEGTDLNKLIDEKKAQGKVYSYHEAKLIIDDVLNGLETLHQRGIIHRDIDPSNIRICVDGSTKLMDFGIARLTGGKTKSLTGVGTLIGKPNYSPPEQIRGESDNIKMNTDLYALGVTIYEMLTSTAPFEKGNEFDTMQAQVNDPLPRSKHLSQSLYQFLKKATAKDQAKRYQTVAEFRQAFELALSKVWWKERSMRITAAAVLVVVVLGLSGFLWYRHNVRNYEANAAKAVHFMGIAQYDSAQYYFEKADDYLSTDSTAQRITMLHALVPGMEDYYSAKYKSAFQKLKEASELGSGDADYYLGELTYNGLGTVKDYQKGWKYSTSAAERGFRMAYWRMANAYQTGKGVKRDVYKSDKYYLEAIEAMKKLAEADDPEALGNLGMMYANGEGVPKNEKLALEYLLRSAKTGYAFIQSNLAQAYQYGSGTDVNLGEAVRWYKASSQKGHPAAQLALGNMYLTGTGVGKSIAEGMKLIYKAANQNYSPALSRLGYLFFMGDIVGKDDVKSFTNTKKAVEFDNDNIVAIENLAYDYRNGVGTAKSYKEAEACYLKAIKNDSTTAAKNYLNIAYLYEVGGFGVVGSEDQFVKYCDLAEKHGNTSAAQVLGVYYNQKGIKAHQEGLYVSARRYFGLAAAKGNTAAAGNVVYMNRRGE